VVILIDADVEVDVGAVLVCWGEERKPLARLGVKPALTRVAKTGSSGETRTETDSDSIVQGARALVVNLIGVSEEIIRDEPTP
jgi:hypothetical protein